RQIKEIKADLKDPNLPWGIDLLLPQVGGNARKTNYDYTGGHLPELIDIMIEEKCRLFVSAVGVPPKWAVDKLHSAGIPVMNMIGAAKHVAKALEVGVDIICAQGTEGGGHTGEVATSVLIPKVCDLVKGRTSPLNGKPILVVAAGGIADGRGLAMALALGASGVWVGTRFVNSKEAGASPRHQQHIIKATHHDTIRTLIYSGRPLRVFKTPYVANWEENRQEEIKRLTSAGVLPHENHVKQIEASGREVTGQEMVEQSAMLMGQVAGNIDDVLSAETIINNMVTQAQDILVGAAAMVNPKAKM
ncbi:2-nitropropane dioxygenase, partial [Hyaloraphidium curvatum]